MRFFSKKAADKPKKPVTTDFLKDLDATISAYKADLTTYQNIDPDEQTALAKAASRKLLETHYKLIEQWFSEVG